jgi:hypothetical protein
MDSDPGGPKTCGSVSGFGSGSGTLVKREHSALQNMNFLKKILLLWVIFALLDPDPLTD